MSWLASVRSRILLTQSPKGRAALSASLISVSWKSFLIGHVHGDHLAGAKRALFDHGGLVDRHHPGLGPGDQQPSPVTT